MRSSLGVLAATVVMLPISVMHALPSDAAAGPVCSTAAGSVVFSPALPVLSKNSLVNTTVVATGTLGKCVGGGVVSAHTVFRSPKGSSGSNCKTLTSADSRAKGFVGTETITWNTGKTSTVTLTLKPAKGTTMSVVGTVTAGSYTGSTQTGQFRLKLPAGVCTTKPLSKLTYTNVAGVKGVFR